jgi:general secretion pathway protein G
MLCFFLDKAYENRSYSHDALAEARVAAAQSDAQSFQLALDNFKRDTGRYPTFSEGLNILEATSSTLPGWKGPYIRNMKADPWGNAYVYHGDSPMTCRILSVGPDGKEGTADDIK